MATASSRFIIQRHDGFGGSYVDSQYLANSYQTGKPHEFNDTLMKVFSAQNRFFTGGKPILGMTGAKSFGKTEIDTEVYRWTLQGAEKRCARVLENLEAGNAAPGLNGTTFRVKLDLDYYSYPEVMLPEDNDFPCAIVSGPIQDGTGYIYTMRLVGDDTTQVLPTDLLEPGREWSKGWTQTPSEANKYFGGQQAPSSFKLESQVGAFAQELEVTDKAMRDQGRLGISFQFEDPKTKKVSKIDRFMPFYEAMMHDELYMSMEAAYLLGRKETTESANKYWTKTGPGLREQLADSWIDYYNGALTVTRLKDYLLNIFFSRVNEMDRKVVAMTGTLGSMMFHDMLAAEASSFLTVDTNFVKEIDSKGRHLSFGAQFTHYKGPEGIEVTLIKNPMYDNRYYCKRTHPQYTDKPIDSSRMTFLDFGTTDNGKQNISMVSVKDTYRYGIVLGTHGPNGPVQGGNVAVKKAGYDMFVEGTGGVWIKDVTRCGELIYDYQY
jgi:hypothetical protein